MGLLSYNYNSNAVENSIYHLTKKAQALKQDKATTMQESKTKGTTTLKVWMSNSMCF